MTTYHCSRTKKTLIALDQAQVVFASLHEMPISHCRYAFFYHPRTFYFVLGSKRLANVLGFSLAETFPVTPALLTSLPRTTHTWHCIFVQLASIIIVRYLVDHAFNFRPSTSQLPPINHFLLHPQSYFIGIALFASRTSSN